MNPPLIALYLPNLKGGGVERMKINMAADFLARGLRVTFVLNEATGELLEKIPVGAVCVDLAAPRTLKALWPLSCYLRHAQPDIVISSLGHNNIIALWARALARIYDRALSCKIIVCQHSAMSLESVQNGNWQHRLLPWLCRMFFRWADAIVAVSNGVAEDMAQQTGTPPARITTLYNPVIFHGFAEAAAQACPHPWLEPNQPPVFLGIGRLVAQKDFATLIRAFAIVRAQQPCRLIIAGAGPERQNLLALAKALGVDDALDLPGFLPAPLPWIAHATALVMSSLYEGFGNVLVEALACGTPVISTNCPYGPAEILANGRYGALVPVGDAAAMARAMQDVLQTPENPARLQAYAAKFGVEQVTEQYLDLMKAIQPDFTAAGK